MTRLSAYPSFRTALPPQPFPCIIEACLRAGNRPATMTYRISVERNTLRFAAAHFTTFGGQCEPLHGHNYDVLIELEGDLTPDSWVFDFVQLKAIAAGPCPGRASPRRGGGGGGEWGGGAAPRRYVIPSADVAALPIDNSTAERLAE